MQDSLELVQGALDFRRLPFVSGGKNYWLGKSFYSGTSFLCAFFFFPCNTCNYRNFLNIRQGWKLLISTGTGNNLITVLKTLSGTFLDFHIRHQQKIHINPVSKYCHPLHQLRDNVGSAVKGLSSLVLLIHHSSAVGILHSVFTSGTYPQQLDPGQSILKGQSPLKCCRIHCTSCIG